MPSQNRADRAAIAEGLRRAFAGVEVDECPLADGGEGTVAALVAATGGRIETRVAVSLQGGDLAVFHDGDGGAGGSCGGETLSNHA